MRAKARRLASLSVRSNPPTTVSSGRLAYSFARRRRTVIDRGVLRPGRVLVHPRRLLPHRSGHRFDESEMTWKIWNEVTNT